MTEGPPAISKKLLPPVWVGIFLLAQVALHFLVPVWQLPRGPSLFGGAAFVAVGVALAIWAVLHFRRARTGILPFSPSTAVVSGGPYRFTRNPMYLGMALGLTGTALLSGSLSPLFLPPLFAWVISRLFIQHEERLLAAQFGEDYEALRRRVRRWL